MSERYDKLRKEFDLCHDYNRQLVNAKQALESENQELNRVLKHYVEIDRVTQALIADLHRQVKELKEEFKNPLTPR